MLDTNGFMSICKQCCEKIYEDAYNAEKNTARALLIACRILNWKFDEDTVSAALLHIETAKKNGTNTNSIVGFYKGKLGLSGGRNFTDRSSDSLTFTEIIGLELEPEDPLEDHEKNAEELKQFWGDKFEFEDYEWLETEYSKWRTTNPPNNRNEETILKLVVLKLLSIRKEINAGHDTSKLEEGLTKLMNAGALSPAQSTAANQGKNKDCFGEWIKEIEKTEPAEWWKDNSIYRDIDNIAEYWKVHILRPFLNFWGIQKDFDFEGAVETGAEDNDDASPSEE
jgi:hypothetical protein